AAIAVDAIQCANDRVEQGETRFRITWLGCNSQQRRLDWSSKPDEPLAVSRETAVLEQRGNALKHFRSCFILRRTGAKGEKCFLSWFERVRAGRATQGEPGKRANARIYAALSDGG